MRIAFTNSIDITSVVAAIVGKSSNPAIRLKQENKATASLLKTLQKFESLVEQDKKASITLKIDGKKTTFVFDPNKADTITDVTFKVGTQTASPRDFDRTLNNRLEDFRNLAHGTGNPQDGGPGTFSGKVIDGYVRGATVFVDYDRDGVLDADEPSTVSDVNGNYTVVADRDGGVLLAVGGTNIDTGNPNTLVLSAPATKGVNESAVRNITPVTTLIQRLAEKTAGDARPTDAQLQQAEAVVRGALGLQALPQSLLTFDPLSVMQAGTSSATDQAAALQVFKAGVQVATLTVTAQEADPVADDPTVAGRVIDALLRSFTSGPQGTGGVDLSDATVLSALLRDAGVAPSASVLQMLAQTNTTVDNASSATAISSQQDVFEDTLRNQSNPAPAPTPTVFNGDDGNNTITGNSLNNTLSGGGGNDTLNGLGGDDVLLGGDGDDLLTGGTGNDTITGGTDNDTVVLSGNIADYTIAAVGTTGNHTITDSVTGRDGTDTIIGSTGANGIEFVRFANNVTVSVKAAAPTIDVVEASDTAGASVTDNISSDTTPTVLVTFGMNTRFVGDQIKLFAGGTEPVATHTLTAADIAAGKVEVTPSASLGADATFSLAARIDSVFGAVGTSSAAISFTLDTTAPAAPVLALGMGVTGGATAAEATQTGGVVTVTGEMGASIAVTFTNGMNTVTKTVTGNGSTPVAVALASADLTTLGDGSISVSAVATDAAGNVSQAGTQSFTLDTTAPAAPVLALGMGVTGGATAAEATQAGGVVTVTGEMGASIAVTFSRTGGGTVTKTVTGNGSTPVAVALVSADLVTLGDGSISVSATQTDAAGNLRTAAAATTSFTLDTLAPAAPVLALGMGVTGGATAAEATQTGGVVTVTGEMGASIAVTFSRTGGGTVTKTVTGNGSTPVAVALASADLTTLGDGSISVSATQTDAAGNLQTAAAATTSFTLDTLAPAAPVITGFADNSGLATDNITNDKSVTLTITAEVGSTVEVFNGTASLGMATAGSTLNGITTYSFTTADLVDATYSFTAKATDVAGNTGAASTAQQVVIDATAPTTATITAATATTFTVMSNEAVTLNYGGGTTPANPLTVTVTNTTGPNGQLLEVADAAGNKAGVTANSVAARLYVGDSNANTSSLTAVNEALLAYGLGGADTLTGGALNDTLIGGAGDDLLTGGRGADRIDVSEGNDTVVVGVTLSTVAGATKIFSDSGDTQSTARVVKDVLQGFDFDPAGGTDTVLARLTASALTGPLNFSPTQNVFVGLNDLQTVTAGGFLASFSTRVGVIDFDNNSDGGNAAGFGEFAVEFDAVVPGNSSSARNDSFRSILRYDITGTNGNDTVTTGGLDDTLGGGMGNDSLNGGAGNDSLMGGSGNDTLSGGLGNDTFNVDAGSDTITDLTTGDVLLVASGATATANNVSTFTATSATNNAGSATLNTPVGDANTGGGGGNIDLTLAGGNGFTLNGGNGGDTLIGGAGNDTIRGGFFFDSLAGGDGNDTFIFAAGEAGDSTRGDTVDGGSGSADTIRALVVSTGTGVDLRTLDLNGATTGGGSLGDGGIERIQIDRGTATLTGADLVNGTTVGFNRVIVTGAQITSQSTQIATDGAGTGKSLLNVQGTTGADLIFLGNMTFDISYVDLRDGIELIGGSGNDTLLGTSIGDFIDGGADSDRIDGGLGNDALAGGLANDTLIGGSGGDTLDGGEGNDQFLYADEGDLGNGSSLLDASIIGGNGTDRISVGGTADLNITSGTFSFAAASSVEELFSTGMGRANIVLGDSAQGAGIVTVNIAASTAANNIVDVSAYTVGTTIVGSSTATNTLRGGIAGDTLSGGSANDTLTGGAGTDSLSGGSGSDVFIVNAAAIDPLPVDRDTEERGTTDSGVVVGSGNTNSLGADTVTGFDLASDTIRVVATNIIGFAHGVDTAVGTGDAGTAGRLQGNFAINVGLIDLSNNDQPNNAGPVIKLDDGLDTAITFAAPIGGTFSKASFEARLQYELTGTSMNDFIATGGLNDILRGAADVDTLNGGLGADTIIGGTGADRIDVGVSSTDVDVLRYTAVGETGTFTPNGTNSVSTTAFDIVQGMRAGDRLDFSQYAGGTAFDTSPNGAATVNIGAGVLENNGLYAIRGTYNSTDNTFVGGTATTDLDTLVIYDADISTGQSQEAFVLVGYVGGITTASDGIATLN